MKTIIDLTAGLIGLAFDEISGVSKDAGLPDDLTEIEGIGPAYAGRLNEAGITTFSQLGELSVDQVRDFMKLSESQGNPEDWLEQARDLS
jgi:predicted flap endonuclease-1-like 5' DNA nuclease